MHIPPSPRSRLFIGGLPDIDRESLREMIQKSLSSYGKIVDLKLMSTYGFVELSTVQDAMDVVSTFQQVPFLGDHRIRIEYSQPLGTQSSRRRVSSSDSDSPVDSSPPASRQSFRLRHPVLITGIPAGTCWQELKDFGRLAGVVAFCDLDRRDAKRGFIEYLLEEDAKVACKDLDGRMLNGGFVSVQLHQSARKIVASKSSRSRSRSPSRHRSRSPPRTRRHRHRSSSHPYPPRQPQEYAPHADPRGLISQHDMYRNIASYDPYQGYIPGVGSDGLSFQTIPNQSSNPGQPVPSASYNATLLSAIRQQRLLSDAIRAIGPQAQLSVDSMHQLTLPALLQSND